MAPTWLPIWLTTARYRRQEELFWTAWPRPVSRVGEAQASPPLAKSALWPVAVHRRSWLPTALKVNRYQQRTRSCLPIRPTSSLTAWQLAAGLVGARRRLICIERGNPSVEAVVRHALSERNEDGVELITTPRRYLAGQESALVDLVNGGHGKPALGRPFERGVDGLPTLVDNVETLAQLALIARFGAQWYREVGTPDDAGSTLVTIAGSVSRPGVYEIAHGWRLDDVLAHAGAHRPRAVLLGGYYGRWASAQQIRGLRLDAASLRKAGLSLGCGVIAVLDDETCAVDEAARVAAWFAANSAGQCGACTWGLRDLAHATGNLVAGDLVAGGPVAGGPVAGGPDSGDPVSGARLLAAEFLGAEFLAARRLPGLILRAQGECCAGRR